MFESNERSPKCQSGQQRRHKDLYKTSPNWQQMYRKQCLSRLQERREERRSRLIDRFRNIDINETCVEAMVPRSDAIVEEVMQLVWNQFEPPLPPINSSDVIDFMEQTRQELLSEEGQYWEELTEWQKQEEIDWLLSNRESVVCFICQKNALKLNSMNDNKSLLFCTKCGFTFMAQFSLSLAYLQERVDDIISKHSSICANTSMKFNLINDCSNNGFNNISVGCDVCRKSDLVFKNFNLSSNQF